MFSPTMRAAMIAGYRWLTASCPGCGMVSDVDLTTVDRHPDGSIMSLIPALSAGARAWTKLPVPHPTLRILAPLSSSRVARCSSRCVA
jgi:hypothetical protein